MDKATAIKAMKELASAMNAETPTCQTSPGEPHPRCGTNCDQPMMLPVDKSQD